MTAVSSPDAAAQRATALDTLSPAIRAQVEAAEAGLYAVQRTITQRDWLNITQVLDRPRTTILEDGGLRLLALAWVKEKAAHGGASWEVLLDMTDEEILALHGFPTSDDEAPQDVEDAPPTAGDVAGEPWPGDNV